MHRGARRQQALREVVALGGLDLTVPAGTVTGSSSNGAGKTTLSRILATLLEPDHGGFCVAGHDVAREGPDAVRDAIGVTGQFSAVDGLLTGTENLALMADLHYHSRANDAWPSHRRAARAV